MNNVDEFRGLRERYLTIDGIAINVKIKFQCSSNPLDVVINIYISPGILTFSTHPTLVNNVMT